MLNPFFIKRIAVMPGYYIWFPILLGIFFLFPYLLVEGKEGISKSAGFLTLIIIFAYLFLYVAVNTFNNILPKLKALCVDAIDFKEKINQYLNDRRFIIFGIVFATLNCLIGFFLDPQSTDDSLNIILGWGYFLSGYLCGMAVCGIYGLIRIFNEIFEYPLKLDFTNPDQKAGTHFLGSAFMIFSGITITEGVLIALYLVTETWNSSLPISEQFDVVNLVEWFWIGWPFILGALVLFIPSLKLNQILIDYKDKEERKINAVLEELRNNILETIDATDKLEMKKSLYSYHDELRKKLYQMNTWPFSVSSLITYTSMFAGNVIVSFQSASKIFEKL